MTLVLIRVVVMVVVVLLVVTPFDFGVLFGNSEASHWLRTGISAGVVGGIVAAGPWVEKLMKRKPVQKPD